MPREITNIEHAMRTDLSEYAEAAMRRSPSILTSVLAYLLLRRGEIRKVYAIVHARVNGLADSILDEALNPLQDIAA